MAPSCLFFCSILAISGVLTGSLDMLFFTPSFHAICNHASCKRIHAYCMYHVLQHFTHARIAMKNATLIFISVINRSTKSVLLCIRNLKVLTLLFIPQCYKLCHDTVHQLATIFFTSRRNRNQPMCAHLIQQVWILAPFTEMSYIQWVSIKV